MDVGHIIRFSSQQNPFVVETSPCLDLDCSCSVMKLTLREVASSGSPPREPLVFTLAVSLHSWTEQDPPPRSLEVETLAREFMARLPQERIDELISEFEQSRAMKKYLRSLSLPGPEDKLVAYSSVVYQGQDIRSGYFGHSYFFVFEGREFLVEDHYCPNPRCDCQQVNVEFWERLYEYQPQPRLGIKVRLIVSLGLDGQLQETRRSEETADTAKYLLAAWQRRCGYQLAEFKHRYEFIKTIGLHSFPQEVKPIPQEVKPIARSLPPSQPTRLTSKKRQRVRRNDPCPCGSGKKYKRCCARTRAGG